MRKPRSCPIEGYIKIDEMAKETGYTSRMLRYMGARGLYGVVKYKGTYWFPYNSKWVIKNSGKKKSNAKTVVDITDI